VRGRLVVLTLEEAEQAPAVVLELVEAVIDVSADAPDRLPVAIGEEVLRLRMLEERVAALVEALRTSSWSGATQRGSSR